MQKSTLSLLGVIGVLLTGCATPIPAGQMVANPNIYPQLGASSLAHAVSVGHVSVSPSMPSKGLVVTPEEFSKALELSVGRAGWLAPQGSAKYQLSANFIDFDQPFTMFSTKIFSDVTYVLEDRKTGSVVYRQTVKIPCVMTMGEVYDVNVREGRTMLCSIRENVTHMMRDINSKF